eukprot:gene10228-11918_t
MGGDIHLCASKFVSKEKYLYIAGLLGALLSVFAALFTICTYLYNKRQAAKAKSTYASRPLLVTSNNNTNANNNLSRSGSSSGSFTDYTAPRQRSPRPKKINYLIFNLTIADLIGCSSIVFSQVCLLGDFDFSHTKAFCVYVRCVIHFGFLASFLWTNCIAFYLLSETYEWKRFPIIGFHIICWGLPAAAIAALKLGDFIVKSPETHW